VKFPDLPASLVIKPDSLSISRQSKGQKAMAAALEIAINNCTTAEAAKGIGVSQAYVAQGLVVAKCAKDLVPKVIDGTLPLLMAYREAVARKAAAAAEAKLTPQQKQERAITEYNMAIWKRRMAS
jgi:hypothetical protein